MNVHIGDIIRLHRISKGWSIADFAGRVGVSTVAAAAWERKEIIPSARFVPQMAKTLGVKAIDLAAGICFASSAHNKRGAGSSESPRTPARVA